VLVMKRRAGESFTIGDDIEIEVLEVAGTRVKLGILAPDSMIIVRKEARITREENITAARSLDPQAIADLVHRLWRQTKTTP
jgi:carbon storage regulator